jgi:hypothetical protein
MSHKAFYVSCAMAQVVIHWLSLWGHGFVPVSVHVGFVADKVALRLVFLQVPSFFPLSNIPLWLSTFIYHLGDEQ